MKTLLILLLTCFVCLNLRADSYYGCNICGTPYGVFIVDDEKNTKICRECDHGKRIEELEERVEELEKRPTFIMDKVEGVECEVEVYDVEVFNET